MIGRVQASCIAAILAAAAASAAQSSVAVDAPLLERINATGSNLFAVLARTQDTVAMRATRVSTAFDPQQRAVRIHEKFQASSDGRFQQELLRIDGDYRRDELPLIKKAYELRGGATRIWREFRVRDVAAALRNYRVVPMGAVQKLGRRLRIFDIYPRRRSASYYRILVDDRYQVVLDQIRLDDRARVQSIMVYTQLEIGPAVVFPPKQSWWTSFNKVETFESIDRASARLGFAPKVPNNTRMLGFSLTSIESVSNANTGTPFLKLGFTDGIELRCLLQRPSPTAVAKRKQNTNFASLAPSFAQRLRQLEATQYFITYSGREFLFVTTTAPAKGLPPLLSSVLR